MSEPTMPDPDEPIPYSVQIATLRRERDEARAEVARLEDELQVMGRMIRVHRVDLQEDK